LIHHLKRHFHRFNKRKTISSKDHAINMTTKLDQSLDVIMKDSRKNRRRNPRRAAQTGKPAPVGGVQKTMKTTKQEKVAIPTGPKTNQSKILVSNLVCTHQHFLD